MLKMMKKHYTVLWILLMMFQSMNIYASRWDIYNKEGQLVLEGLEADSIYYIDESRIVAGRNKSIIIFTGYNYSEQRTVSNIFISSNSQFHSNRISVYNPKTLKHGFIDLNAQIVIPMVFDYVEDFVGDYAVFGCGDTSEPPPHSLKYGLMNNSGEIIRECLYWEIKILQGDDNPIYITKKDSEQVIVRRNKGKEDIIHLPNEFQTVLSGVNTLDLIIYSFDGQYGYLDYNGNIALEPMFKTIISSSENKVIAANEDNERYIFDITTGEVKNTDNALWFLGNDRILIEMGNEWGVLGSNDEVLVEPVYDNIFPIGRTVYVVKDSSGYGVLLSPPGKLIRRNYSDFYQNADSDYFALKRR